MSPTSEFSQDMTFFTRERTGDPRVGGWTLSAIAGAPPAPVETAPTTSAAIAAAAAAAAALSFGGDPSWDDGG